jgi:carbamoyltransferase
MDHACLGPAFDNEAIEKVLKTSKLKYRRLEDVCKTTAEWIAKGAIVGWFQGGMEFGPRALGARSILADATRPEMKDVLNRWVKHREDFRPFAPAVCEENFHEYFIHPRLGEKDAGGAEFPFMLFVCPVKEAAKERIPAVTHVDGTARVQTVTEKVNPRYYQLIREFEKITGVPVIVNTSFNVRGEPIVCTPQDALRCFFTTGIDVLVMGDFLIEK